MAQTAGAICVAAKIAEQAKPKQVFFMTIDKCKFRKPVEPGDTVEYHMTKLNNRRNMWWYKGEAKVDGTLVCEAEVSAMLVTRMSETLSSIRAPSSRTARSSARASRIGPFCLVGPQVELGDGCELKSHVVVAGRTTIGPRTKIYPFASIGHAPQDLKYRRRALDARRSAPTAPSARA